MKRFDTFTVNEENKFAVGSALAISSFDTEFEPLLAIYGQSGKGKSHLLAAVANEVQRQHTHAKVMETTGPQFLESYHNSVTYGDVADYVEGFVKIDMLIVDDASAIIHSDDEGAKKMFYRIVSGLVRNQRRVVVALDENYDAEDRSDDVQNLLTSGVVAFIG